MTKRFCSQGHDTSVVGKRNSGQCKACSREANRRYNKKEWMKTHEGDPDRKCRHVDHYGIRCLAHAAPREDLCPFHLHSHPLSAAPCFPDIPATYSPDWQIMVDELVRVVDGDWEMRKGN